MSGRVLRISHVEERPFRTSQSPSGSPRRGHGRSTTRPSHRQRRPYLDRRFHCLCRSRYLDRSPAARAATFHIGGRSRRGALPRHRQDAASRSPSHADPAGKQTRCSQSQRERDPSAEPRTGDRQPDTAECAVKRSTTGTNAEQLISSRPRLATELNHRYQPALDSAHVVAGDADPPRRNRRHRGRGGHPRCPPTLEDASRLLDDATDTTAVPAGAARSRTSARPNLWSPGSSRRRACTRSRQSVWTCLSAGRWAARGVVPRPPRGCCGHLCSSSIVSCLSAGDDVEPLDPVAVAREPVVQVRRPPGELPR